MTGSLARRILVVGGNGYVGSTVCRLAVGRGWEVHSLARSGQPFMTPSGHRPAWTEKVVWHAGSAFDPSTYAHLLPATNAVVHTLGVLLEGDYKSGGLSGALNSVAQGFANQLLGDRGNPLSRSGQPSQGKYEAINRDSALAVFDAFASSSNAPDKVGDEPSSSAFVYLSAEDTFRPVIPARYINTKREAERLIAARVRADTSDRTSRVIRPIFARPSLIYHPHLRPLSTLPATLLDASAHAQRFLPSSLRATTAASRFPWLPAVDSLANLVSIPPVHVDTVGEAICRSIEQQDVEGVVGVSEMRKLVGFQDTFDHLRAEAAA